jgi:DNA-binding FadR family transcriptional regulator
LRNRPEDDAIPVPFTIKTSLAQLLIVSGRHPAGELLETESNASERHHVSRPAYREAVRMLAAKGLVESRPKVGTRVTAREKWHLLDPDVLSWMFQSQPDDHLLDALFELRMIVEPQAAALAAKRRTSEHLDRMKRGLAAMLEHSLASAEGRAGDQEFHAALLVASDNPFLRTLTTSVSTAVAWTTELKQRVRPLVRDPIPDHERVYEAIAARDTEGARAAMAKLVELALFDTKTAPKGTETRRSDEEAA